MTSVVVLCLDSVRKDYFDEFAKNIQNSSDYSLNECRSASSWSVPSHASFLTGALPTEHGVHTDNLDFSTADPETVLTNRLNQHSTIYIGANQFMTPEFGFDSWFDRGYSLSPGQYYCSGLDQIESDGIRDHLSRSLKSDHPYKSLINGALGKLNHVTRQLPIPRLLDDGARSISRKARVVADEEKSNLFLFINMMDAHLPHTLFRGMNQSQFDLPVNWTSTDFDHWEYNKADQEDLDQFSEDLEYFREFYAASIEYLDRRVTALIEQLEDQIDDDVVSIIISDHGENLGGRPDRYLLEHTGSLTEGLLHIPVEIVNSPIEISGTESLSSLLELPELVEAIIEGRNYNFGEHTVSAEIIGEGLHLTGKGDEFWDRAIRCTYDDKKKFEWDSIDNQYLFEIGTDGPSTESIIKENATIDEKLKARFERDLTEYKQEMDRDGAKNNVDINESTKSHLQRLGYMD